MRVSGVSPHTGPSRCRSCGESVVWAITDAGKRMPVNPTPALPGVGNLVLWFQIGLDGKPVDGKQYVSSVPREDLFERYTGPAWQSHFATCPHASEHRKGGADVRRG